MGGAFFLSMRRGKNLPFSPVFPGSGRLFNKWFSPRNPATVDFVQMPVSFPLLFPLLRLSSLFFFDGGRTLTSSEDALPSSPTASLWYIEQFFFSRTLPFPAEGNRENGSLTVRSLREPVSTRETHFFLFSFLSEKETPPKVHSPPFA